MAIGTTRPFTTGIVALCLVSLIVSVVGLFGESSVANATTPAQVYVSVAGSGLADCSSSANSCTLATARTAVHALTASTLTSNIVVSLADGTYPVASTMNFSSTDSGNNGFTVTWQASPGAHPVFSGASTLTGWQPVAGNPSVYYTTVPTGTTSRQLYVNGRRAARANRAGDAFSNWTTTSTGYTVSKSSFIDLSVASGLEFVYPGGAGMTDWVSTRCDVATVATDPGNATLDVITMVQPCYANAMLTARPSLGPPDAVENGYGMVGTPGQWYLDSAAGKVYYTPLAGEALTDTSALLPTTDGLLSATNLSFVNFTGLAFEYATWMGASGPQGEVDLQANLLIQGTPTARSVVQLPSAVTFHASNHINFTLNTLAHLGSGGVAFDQGSNNNVIQGNTIYDTSSNGVTLGTATANPDVSNSYAGPTYVDYQETVANNYVHDIGVEFEGAVGIFASWVKQTKIIHNEVFRTSYSGISLGWGWGNTSDPAAMSDNHVDFNYVHETMTTSLTDGGAIYTNGLEASTPVSTVIGNYIDGDGKVNAALYLDNGSSYFDVERNVVTNASVTNAVGLSPGGWGNPNTVAQFNTIANNYGSNTAGAVSNSTTNTIGTNSWGLTSWPSAATAIIASAGLEAAYGNLNPSPEVNLALRGTATASSTYDSRYYSAQAAIDSNSNTLWASTATDNSASLTVDLGASQTIESVVLLPRQDTNYSSDDRRNIQIIGSNNANMSSPTTLCTLGSVPTPFALPIKCSQGGTIAYRYIQAKKTVAGGFTIGELRIFGPGTRTQ